MRYDHDFQIALDQLMDFGYVGYSEIIYDAVFSKYNALTKTDAFPTIGGMLAGKQKERDTLAESLLELQRLKREIGLAGAGR